MVELWRIFLVFLRLGALTFGGGLAMIPIIRRDVVDRGWINEEDFNDYIAVAQVAPGMIAINIATLIGTHLRGLKGALISVIGVALPSILVIMCIASLLTEFADVELVQKALKGIIIVVVVLLSAAIFDVGKKAIINIPLAIYALFCFSLVYFLKTPIMFVVLMSFTLGSIHTLIFSKRGRKND